jgi:HD superfamily phosphohydrolase
MKATKYFQDPLYGHIPVSSPLLLRLIDSRAMQRLKHVRQLGTSFFTYLGAEHSRFSHSLGAQHLMGVVLDHLQREQGLKVTAQARELGQCAALLHDIGHCAYSHTLEHVLGHSHEEMGVRLIREDPELRAILGGLVSPVAALITGQPAGPGALALKSLISSQLDVDRLDYLVRDAHYTGVGSGKVDVTRIVGTFAMHQGSLVVLEKGALAVEEYFLARYFMYWKVYFHKTSRCMELIMKALLRRARELQLKKRLDEASLTPALRVLFEKGPRVPVKAFLDHDDSDVLVGIKAWQYSADPILADLSRRFLRRQKFKLIHEANSIDEKLTSRQAQKIRDYFEARHPGSADYYFYEDQFGDLPYDPDQPVYLLTEKGRKEELSRRSEAIRGILHKLVQARYYVPHEHAAAALKLIR